MSTSQRVRIATYNVHKCEGMDGRTSAERIAEVIAECSPDVIGLQEVLSLEEGGFERNQAEFLADRLGMHLAMGDVRRLRGGLYGNIVLSRLPLRGHCQFDLSVPGREQRGCVRTDVDLGIARPLHLFNFHLGTAFLERRKQAKLIFESKIVKDPDLEGPRVVVGDFNEWTRGMVSRALAAEFRGADIRLHLKAAGHTRAFCPFCTSITSTIEDLVLERVSLHRTRKSVVASDHLPLVADFAVKSEL